MARIATVSIKFSSGFPCTLSNKELIPFGDIRLRAVCFQLIAEATDEKRRNSPFYLGPEAHGYDKQMSS